MMGIRDRARLLPIGAALWLLAATGCSNTTASVSGSVTFDGQPVGDGYVTFRPADGIGPDAGAKIIGGRYSLDGIKPGPKVVQVIAVKKVPFARTSEEMARRAAESKAKGDASGLIDPADTIPPDAEGNNATHEIKAGKQTLNVELKTSGQGR
jgi:hypothetical protein